MPLRSCIGSNSTLLTLREKVAMPKQPTSPIGGGSETFQREGAKSNAHVGDEFEQVAAKFLTKSEGWVLQSGVKIPVGFDRKSRMRLIWFARIQKSSLNANRTLGQKKKGTSQAQNLPSGTKRCCISFSRQMTTERFCLSCVTSDMGMAKRWRHIICGLTAT